MENKGNLSLNYQIYPIMNFVAVLAVRVLFLLLLLLFQFLITLYNCHT